MKSIAISDFAPPYTALSDNTYFVQDRQSALRKFPDFLIHLRHPHLVNFSGSFSVSNYYVCLSEYVDKGTLAEYIKTQPPFSWKLRISYLTDICRGLEFLQTKNIFCNDLSIDSVFITKNNRVKIGKIGTKENSFLKGNLYSFGIVMVILLTGNIQRSEWKIGRQAFYKKEQEWIKDENGIRKKYIQLMETCLSDNCELSILRLRPLLQALLKQDDATQMVVLRKTKYISFRKSDNHSKLLMSIMDEYHLEILQTFLHDEIYLMFLVLEYYGIPELLAEDLDPLPEKMLARHVIGRGVNTVYRALYKGQEVAVRSFHMNRTNGFALEFKWQAFKHRHIVNVFGFVPPNLSINEDGCAVMERGKMTLDTYYTDVKLIGNPDWDISMLRKLDILRQTAAGLRYLHIRYVQPLWLLLKQLDLESFWSSEILMIIARYCCDIECREWVPDITLHHNGLRPTKIFFRPDDSVFVAALAEGTKPYDDDIPPTRGARLYLKWMAPELYTEFSLVEDPANDIYSFGLLLWYVFTRTAPWMGVDKEFIWVRLIHSIDDFTKSLFDYYYSSVPSQFKSTFKIQECELPSNMPQEYLQLMKSCLTRDYKLRPDIDFVQDKLEKLYILENLKK